MRPELDPVDRLSALLERFRVHTHLFHSGALCGLTTFDARPGRAFLHVLRRGELVVTHRARSGAPRRLRLSEPGVLFYPRPITHQFHNPPVDGADFTCATLRFDGGERNPLVRALPPLIVLPLAQVDGLGPALNLLFAETGRVRCGQRLLADRLFEVVLIQLLRWIIDHHQEAGVQPGLVTGLSDPRIARVLVAMHESPGAAWGLRSMAARAGMSRSAFAATFKAVVGQPPVDYLADWRMTLAQSMLRDGQSVKLIAKTLGYANASALSRLFRARSGLSPSRWISQAVSGEPAGTPAMSRA